MRKIIENTVRTHLIENDIEWGKDKVAGRKVNPLQYVYHISEKKQNWNIREWIKTKRWRFI